jgi:hypothetical protein
MFKGRFRSLVLAIAGFMVLAIGAASIPAVSRAEGGEGRDSHERTKDPGKEPRQPPPTPFNEKRF